MTEDNIRSGRISPGRPLRRTRARWVMWGILGLLLTVCPPAAVYHVTATGSDAADGSADHPWQTLQHAADTVDAGDTVIVGDGTYAGFRSTGGGTPDQPIVFRTAGGAVVVIDRAGPDNVHGSGIEIENHDWWTIEGFEVTGLSLAGIDVRVAAHVTVRYCYAHHNGKWGIFTAYADYFTAEANECAWSAQEHGIYFSNSADYPVLVENICHHNNGSGIQLNADPLYPGDGITSQATVCRNILYENGAGGGAAINLASVRDSLIADNLLYANHAGGIAGWDDGDGTQWGTRDNDIINNTVHMPADGRWALSLKNGSTGNRLRNNILIHDGSRGGIEIDNYSLTGLDSDYNVLSKVSVDDTWLSLAAWQSGYGRDAATFDASAAATFVDPATDHTLLAGALARDSGVAEPTVAVDLEGALRPQGPAWDRGAYEYVVPGDTDGDGDLDAVDVTRLAVWLTGVEVVPPFTLRAADTSGDGLITAADLVELMIRLTL